MRPLDAAFKVLLPTSVTVVRPASVRNNTSMRKHTYGIDQRSFLHYMATASAIPAIAQRVEVQVTTSPRFGDNPFTLGVASGDPEPDGVVIWNRLAFKPADGGGMVNEPISVQWEVATDEAFGNVVQKGSSPAMPQPGHSVHVEVDGLQPHRWYFYRFHAGLSLIHI